MKKEYTAEQIAAHRAAVRKYESKNYRLNMTLPAGTKERIESLGLDITASAFIRAATLEKLEELEKQKNHALIFEKGIDKITHL